MGQDVLSATGGRPGDREKSDCSNQILAQRREDAKVSLANLRPLGHKGLDAPGLATLECGENRRFRLPAPINPKAAILAALQIEECKQSPSLRSGF